MSFLPLKTSLLICLSGKLIKFEQNRDQTLETTG